MDKDTEKIAVKADVKSIADAVIEQSKYGKFKSLEALLQAYNELEAEFTRKCQIIKQMSENTVEELPKPITVPLYEREDWGELLAGFIANYPIARGYATNIGKILIDEPEIATQSEGLELALLKVLSDKFRTPEELASDRDFVDNLIITNTDIRDRIISEYINSISHSNTPETISRGGELFITPPRKPKNLEEAGRLAGKILGRA